MGNSWRKLGYFLFHHLVALNAGKPIEESCMTFDEKNGMHERDKNERNCLFFYRELFLAEDGDF